MAPCRTTARRKRREDRIQTALEDCGIRPSEERAESAAHGPSASGPPGRHIAITPRGGPRRGQRVRSPAHRKAHCCPSSCRLQRTDTAMDRLPAETAHRPDRLRARCRSAEPARSRMQQAWKAPVPKARPEGQSHRRQDRRQTSAGIGPFPTGAWPRHTSAR